MEAYGRYSLIRRIGSGGMAEVWKARAAGPSGFQKEFALKRVLPHLTEDSEFVEMFIDEAKLVAGLVHPNIVQVFDFGSVGAHEYYLAMEYVAGANLASLQKRLEEARARWSPDVAAYITIEACRGLGYAHEKTDTDGRPLSLVHRDVSPQNVLVSFGGEVKVTDFGIARAAHTTSRTAAGLVRGKLAYMSPEQAAGEPIDARSDLFSLGLVLYELLFGRRLFHGGSTEIARQIQEFTSIAQEELDALPPAIADVLVSTLALDPRARFQRAADLEASLAGYLGARLVAARRELSELICRLFEAERVRNRSDEKGPAERSTEMTEELASEPFRGAMAMAASGEPHRSSEIGSDSVTFHVPGVVIREQAGGPSPGPLSRRRAAAGVAVGAAGALFAGLFTHRWLSEPRTRLQATEPKPAPTPIAAETTPGAPSQRSTPNPSTGYATLGVAVRPWAEVWIDGKLMAAEASNVTYRLRAGVHRVRLVNPGNNFSKEIPVKLDPGAKATVSADIRTGSIQVESR